MSASPLPNDLRLLDDRDLLYALDRLNNDYVHALDADDIEQWPGFFTEDGVYKVLPRENYENDLPIAVMYCEGRGMMRDRVTAIRETLLFAPRALRHLTGNTRILAVEDGMVRAQTNYAVFESTRDNNTDVFNTGRYLDQVAIEDGVLRYRERLCVYDSSLIPTSMIYPI